MQVAYRLVTHSASLSLSHFVILSSSITILNLKFYEMRSQWYRALNENCHFANMTTVENKHCTHKMQKTALDLGDVPPLRYFSMPVHFVSS